MVFSELTGGDVAGRRNNAPPMLLPNKKAAG